MPVRKLLPQEQQTRETYQSFLPDWLQPGVESSVFDPWYRKPIRDLVRYFGADDPNTLTTNLTMAGFKPGVLPEMSTPSGLPNMSELYDRPVRTPRAVRPPGEWWGSAVGEEAESHHPIMMRHPTAASPLTKAEQWAAQYGDDWKTEYERQMGRLQKWKPMQGGIYDAEGNPRFAPAVEANPALMYPLANEVTGTTPEQQRAYDVAAKKRAIQMVEDALTREAAQKKAK